MTRAFVRSGHGYQACVRTTAAAVLVLQVACGAPQEVADDDAEVGMPTLSLLAEPASIEAGGSVRLTWDAAHAEMCVASGGWTGSRSSFGVEAIGPLDSDTTFILSCSNAHGDGVMHQVEIEVDDGSAPDVQIHAGQQVVPVNGVTELNWTAEDATRCVATGGWSGSQPLSGSASVGPLVQTTRFGLTCSSGAGVALASITVEVMHPAARAQDFGRNLQNPGTGRRYDG